MSLTVSLKKRLHDYTLQVEFEKGEERLGILGASGDGKSMALKCIAGIEKPDSGKIVLNDRVLYDSSKNINLIPQQRKVGYLFQNYALFPNMTVEQNIGAALKGSSEKKKTIVAEQIKRFHLEGLEKSFPMHISGGQQQRVALARIMAYQPELIMLDEPFSALDGYLKDLLQEQLLESLQNYKGDIILVSHSRDEIYHFCEKLVFFVKGKALLMGDTKELFQNPKKVEAARLTGCKNICEVKKIEEQTLYCKDWDVVLRTKEKVSDRVRHVGIRAHALRPATEGKDTNTIPVEVTGIAEMPFEVRYKIKNKSVALNLEEKDHSIWWYVSKNSMEKTISNQIPEYLYFPPESLMLLE